MRGTRPGRGAPAWPRTRRSRDRSGQLEQRGPRPGEVLALVDDEPAGDRGRQGAQRSGARGGHAGDLAGREPLGRREQAHEAVLGPRQWLTVTEREPLRQAPAGSHRHLLAEHRAHGQLEAVPGARQAQPGPRLDERPEQRVAAKRGVDAVGFLVTAEQEPGRRPGRGVAGSILTTPGRPARTAVRL